MVILLIRQAAILIGAALAAYTDARTGLILDKITYPMIALGLILNLLEFELTLFAVPVAVFAVGFALYWFGKVGGGDVKLFTGIAMLLPFFGGKVFVVHVLLVAVLASIVFYSVYYTARYWRKGIDLNENKDGVLKAAVLGVVMAAYFYYVFAAQLLPVETITVFVVATCFALLFLALEKGIKKNFFLKDIELGKLDEDEVIAEEFLEPELKKKLAMKGKGIIGKKEIQKLKELGVKVVPVYQNMPPFGPFILLGVAVVLLKPELLGFLII